MEAVAGAGTMRTMTGRRSHIRGNARRRPTIYAKVVFVLLLVCVGAAIAVNFSVMPGSLAVRPFLLTRVFIIVLCMIPAVYIAMVFSRPPICILPGATPHCLRCGYPADVPAAKCPECGVVRTDRVVVLGEPKFLPIETARVLWAIIMFSSIGAAVMAAVAFRY